MHRSAHIFGQPTCSAGGISRRHPHQCRHRQHLTILKAGCASQTSISAVSSYEPPRFESRGSEASAPFWSSSGLSSERAVPIAATPAARAAFLATCLAFGRRAFFVLPVLFPLVVFLLVAGRFALFDFLVFDLVFARFNEDLAFARLALFMLPPLWWAVAGVTLNSPQSNRVWGELITHLFRAEGNFTIVHIARRNALAGALVSPRHHR